MSKEKELLRKQFEKDYCLCDGILFYNSKEDYYDNNFIDNAWNAYKNCSKFTEQKYKQLKTENKEAKKLLSKALSLLKKEKMNHKIVNDINLTLNNS